MTIIISKTKHKDGPVLKVSANGVQIGFVFQTRFSWGYCNARSGGFPKSWVSSAAENLGDAVEKLVRADSELVEMVDSLLKTGEWSFKP